LLDRLVIRLAAKLRYQTCLELDDLVQIGRQAAIEVMAKLDPERPETWEAYAGKAIRGALLNAITKEAVESQHEEFDPERDERVQPAVDLELIQKQQIERVLNAIPHLTDRQRRIIELRYTQGLTQEAAAGVLQITQPAALDLEKRAIESIRRRLADEELDRRAA
jgi:RNA polymerase sigma factor (sigma-70 family)